MIECFITFLKDKLNPFQKLNNRSIISPNRFTDWYKVLLYNMADTFGAKLKKTNPGGSEGGGTSAPPSSPSPPKGETPSSGPVKSPFLKKEGGLKSPFLSKGGDDEGKPPMSPMKKPAEAPGAGGGLKSPFLKKGGDDDGGKPPRSPLAKASTPAPAAEEAPNPFAGALRKAKSPSPANAGSATPSGLGEKKRSITIPVNPPTGETGGGTSEAPAATEDAPSLSRKMSRKDSVASTVKSVISKKSSHHESVNGSEVAATERDDDVRSVAESIARQGSTRSIVSATEAYAENQKLKAQIESLQRIMASGDQEAKVNRLNDDLQARAKRIKELETELKTSQGDAKKWKAEAEKAKKLNKKKSLLNVAESVSHQDDHEKKDDRIEELEEIIKKLQSEASMAAMRVTEVPAAHHSHATSHSDGPPPPKAAAGTLSPAAQYGAQYNGNNPQLIEEVQRLKQSVAERNSAIEQLNQKLERAQSAILSSAGVGWEADVKLHQTKGMLQKMLKAASPPREGRQGSLPTATAASPTAGTPTTKRVLNCCLVEFQAVEEGGTMKLQKVMNGVTSVIGSLRCTAGVVYDHSGSILPITNDVATFSQLAQLADLCKIPHNLPATPTVVVAGHTVGSPQNRYRSPPRNTAYSPSARSPQFY